MKQIAIALDQLANALLGGMADETLSARAYRLDLERGRPWPRRIIDGLFFWQRAHCRESWRSEIARAHLPAHYRPPAVTTPDTTSTQGHPRASEPSSTQTTTGGHHAH